MAIQEVIIESLAVKHIANVGFTTIGKDFTQEDRLAPNPHSVLSKEIPAEEWQTLTPAQAVSLGRVEKHVIKLRPDPTTGTAGNEKAFYSVEAECIEPGHSARGEVFTQGFLTVPGSADWIVELFEDNGSGTGPDYGSPITLGKGNSWAIYPPTGILWLEAGNTLNSFTKPFWMVGYTYVGKTLDIFNEQEQSFNNLIVNSSFDHWFNNSVVPDGWDKGAGDTSEETSDVIFGAGALRFDQVPGQQFWVRQYPSGYGVGELKPGWAGKDVVFSVYAKATSTTKTLLLRLEDGVTSTEQSFAITDEWVRYDITHRLDANADRIRVFIAPEAVGVNATTTVTLLVDGAMLSFGSALVPFRPRTINDTHNNVMYGNLEVEGTSNLKGDVTVNNLEGVNVTVTGDFSIDTKAVNEIEDVITDNTDALPTSSAVWDYVEGKLIVPDPTGEDGKFLVANGGTYGWSDTEYATDLQAGIVKTSADIGVDVNGALEILKEMLPTHTTNGAFLISNGVDTASWSTTQYATDLQAGLVKTSADIGVDVNGALELLAETLPDQSGHAGQFLVTDGNSADWTGTQWASLTAGGLVKASADIGVNASTGEMELLADTLPDQTGHAGEFLVTDGNSADWTGTAYATQSQAGIVKAGTVIGVDGNGALELNGMTTTYDDPNYKIRVDGDFSITDHSGAATTSGSLKWDGTHFWGYVNGDWEILDQYSPFELDPNINWNPAPDPSSPPPNTSDIVGVDAYNPTSVLQEILPQLSEQQSVTSWQYSDDKQHVFITTYGHPTHTTADINDDYCWSNDGGHDSNPDRYRRHWIYVYDMSNPSSPALVHNEMFPDGLVAGWDGTPATATNGAHAYLYDPTYMPFQFRWHKDPSTNELTLFVLGHDRSNQWHQYYYHTIICFNGKVGQFKFYAPVWSGFPNGNILPTVLDFMPDGNKLYNLSYIYNTTIWDNFYSNQILWDANNHVTLSNLDVVQVEKFKFDDGTWGGSYDPVNGFSVSPHMLSKSIDGKIFVTDIHDWFGYNIPLNNNVHAGRWNGDAYSPQNEIHYVVDVSNPASLSIWGFHIQNLNHCMLWKYPIYHNGQYLVGYDTSNIYFYDFASLPGAVVASHTISHSLTDVDWYNDYHKRWTSAPVTNVFEVVDDNLYFSSGDQIEAFDISNLNSASQRFLQYIDVMLGEFESGGITGAIQRFATGVYDTGSYPYYISSGITSQYQVAIIGLTHSGADPQAPFSDYANLNVNGTIYAVNGIKVGDNVDPNVTDGFIRYHNNTLEGRINGSWQSFFGDLFDGTDITWQNSIPGPDIPLTDVPVLGLEPVILSSTNTNNNYYATGYHDQIAVSGTSIFVVWSDNSYSNTAVLDTYSYTPGSGVEITSIQTHDFRGIYKNGNPWDERWMAKLCGMPGGRCMVVGYNSVGVQQYPHFVKVFDVNLNELYSRYFNEDSNITLAGDACYDENDDIYYGNFTDEDWDSGYLTKLDSALNTLWSIPLRAVYTNISGSYVSIYPQAMCADSNYVYFCYSNKLYILNQPDYPVTSDYVLSHGHKHQQMFIRGDILYIGDGNTIYSYDVSDRSNPSYINIVASGISSFTIFGKTLFAVGVGNISCYDISDPVNDGFPLIESRTSSGGIGIAVGQNDQNPTPIVHLDNGGILQAGDIQFAPDTFHQYANMNVNGTIYASQGIQVGLNTDATPPAGLIQYNSGTGHFEGYHGGSWLQLDNDDVGGSSETESYYKATVTAPATQWTGTKIPDSGASSGQWVQSNPQATVTFDEGLFGSAYTVSIICKGNEATGNNRCDLIFQYYDGSWQTFQTFDVLVTDDQPVNLTLGDVSPSDYPGEKRFITSHTGDTGTHYLLIDSVTVTPKVESFTEESYLCEDPGVATYKTITLSNGGSGDEENVRFETFTPLIVGQNIAFGGTYKVFADFVSKEQDADFSATLYARSASTGDDWGESGWTALASWHLNSIGLGNVKHYLGEVDLKPPHVYPDSELKLEFWAYPEAGGWSPPAYVYITSFTFENVSRYVSIPRDAGDIHASESFEIGNVYLSNGTVFNVYARMYNNFYSSRSCTTVLQMLSGSTWVDTAYNSGYISFGGYQDKEVLVAGMTTLRSGTYRLAWKAGDNEIRMQDPAAYLDVIEEGPNGVDVKTLNIGNPSQTSSTSSWGVDFSSTFTSSPTGTGILDSENWTFSLTAEPLNVQNARTVYYKITTWSGSAWVDAGFSGQFTTNFGFGSVSSHDLFSGIQLPAGQYRIEYMQTTGPGYPTGISDITATQLI